MTNEDERKKNNVCFSLFQIKSTEIHHFLTATTKKNAHSPNPFKMFSNVLDCKKNNGEQSSIYHHHLLATIEKNLQ